MVIVNAMFRKIAHILLGYAHTAGTYSSHIANVFFAAAKRIASMDDSELATVIHNSKLEHKFVPKKSVPEYAESEFYDSGAIYFAGSSIPVKLRANEELSEVDIKQSKRFKTVMNTDVINEAYQPETPGMDLLTKLMIAVVIQITAILGIAAYFVFV